MNFIALYQNWVNARKSDNQLSKLSNYELRDFGYNRSGGHIPHKTS